MYRAWLPLVIVIVVRWAVGTTTTAYVPLGSVPDGSNAIVVVYGEWSPLVIVTVGWAVGSTTTAYIPLGSVPDGSNARVVVYGE